jgi:hypothetical protein
MVAIFSIDDVEVIKKLRRSYSNDMELGSKVRSLYRDIDVCKSFTNDQDLGKQIRKMFK